MSGWRLGMREEWRLILRARLTVAALVLLCLLSCLAVAAGLHEVSRQQHTIARAAALHELRAADVYERHAGDVGMVAYYSFYFTADPPSNAAFLALGLRDVAPFIQRVRMLGLQWQVYDGEHFNPELALPGRFDFAFVLVYLAPLFVIALLHDLVSGERQAGRLRLLLSMPGSLRQLWLRRVALRYGLVLACLALPMLAGAAVAGMPWPAIAAAVAVVASYLVFWFGVALLVVTRGWRSRTNATVLMGIWVGLTVVLPVVANIGLARAIPVNHGIDLMLAQRQAVHAGWEVPREVTMRQFVRSHPQWAGIAPPRTGFNWAWYYALHQVGDESVAGQVQAYRAGLDARQQWTGRLGWLLPGVAAQAFLHRLAHTDLDAQLAFQDRIGAFHQSVRTFHYPYLFGRRALGAEDFAARPAFAAATPQPHVASDYLLAAIVLPWLLGALGLWAMFAVRLRP
ncbi:ABC transporter permease [Cupriavidus sp. NPDC089707]|uniref:ABC transporter permease n=1 Tax=Cupriavidus sp. NPDC089707 TaxID=3363963 RepID=UPI003825D2C2